MKSSKVFWGIFFILAAVYVVISKFGILPDIGVFSIILTVFFLWLFVEGIRNVNFWEILFSIAFICIIYDKPLGITALTPWNGARRGIPWEHRSVIDLWREKAEMEDGDRQCGNIQQ